jgi:pimeloyl-ACP methyl ester carboxylesterase
VNPMPTSTMVEVLTPIWQRVLQLSSVGIDDNFFDLGGDSALALELFNEVALACGRELPPVTIYHAPTISALAALLEQPTSARIPPLIQLKAGSDPPVFIAHGLGGSAMDFFQIVKHIRPANTIYGMQAKGIDGVEEPLDRIEDMAQYSLDAVKQVQPHGPYFLIGFSLGGLVTLEMAQQLMAQGEKIGLLAMLDSYPNMRYLSLAQRARLATRLAWRWVASRMQWLGVSRAFPNYDRFPGFAGSATFPRGRSSGAGTVSAAVLSGENQFCQGGNSHGLPCQCGCGVVRAGASV